MKDKLGAEVAGKLLTSLLQECLAQAKVTLPKQVLSLDVGAGEWGYAESLYSFLSAYKGSHQVELAGIDILGKNFEDSIRARIINPRISYHSSDLFAWEKHNHYDIVFLIHMFPPYRFKDHKIPFKPYTEVLSKLFLLLKDGGILVIIAFGSPEEEYSFFDDVPKEKVLLKKRYSNEEATQADYLLGKDTFHDNMVLIARK